MGRRVCTSFSTSLPGYPRGVGLAARAVIGQRASSSPGRAGRATEGPRHKPAAFWAGGFGGRDREPSARREARPGAAPADVPAAELV